MKGVSKHPDLFCTRDAAKHDVRRRIHGNVWNMSSILEGERYIDDIMDLFMQKMGRCADQGRVIDLGLWTWR